MGKFVKIILLTVGGLVLIWMMRTGSEGPAPVHRASVPADDQVSECINRGLRYFREIEAYPRLSDGRDALDVAAERCRRTTTAFP